MRCPVSSGLHGRFCDYGVKTTSKQIFKKQENKLLLTIKCPIWVNEARRLWFRRVLLFHCFFVESPLHQHKTFIIQWYIGIVKRGLTKHNKWYHSNCKPKNTFANKPPTRIQTIFSVGLEVPTRNYTLDCFPSFRKVDTHAHLRKNPKLTLRVFSRS